MPTRQKLSEKPSKEALDVQNALIEKTTDPNYIPPITGYGVPRKFTPPKLPAKPDDAPIEVVQWLDSDG